ncbi:transcriptional regulator, MerR family [Bacteriovorax sp. BSW11_IV]|uniref:MerR family transcriptional regulator n=1 Tax=Bacteriovorax sp. BSW11_IV TaxID=1353529 RepID=UPI00038A459C|nr:MerR family transcriptional regulator [Bacteriovorax sp. BSW11_IV]EQC44947.1 transcriptional regulator, MerR family [Bacteriovorax sp. BSW11_IV]
MKIGELASKCELAPSAIRYYESRGLLKSVTRKSNGYRIYTEDAVILLKVIVNAKQAGFSLDEIKQILPADASNWEHDKLVKVINVKIKDIENLQAQLRKNKSKLKEVLRAIESKPSDMACKDNAKKVLGKI